MRYSGCVMYTVTHAKFSLHMQLLRRSTGVLLQQTRYVVRDGRISVIGTDVNEHLPPLFGQTP